MTLLRLAYRNVFRHRLRTFLIALVVAYVAVATIFYGALMDGYQESVLYAHSRYVMAPVTVARSAWFDDPQPENGLSDLGLAENISKTLGTAVAPRLEFSALIESPYKSEGAELTGVDPEAEKKISKVPGKVEAGRWLKAPGEVVVGYKVAERLGLRLGDRLVISAAHMAGPQALGFRVVGIVNAGVSSVDAYGVYIHIDDARELTGLTTATHLAVDAPFGREALRAREIRPLLSAGLEAKDAWSIIGPIKTDVEAGKASGAILNWLLAALSAIAVTSTIYVSVLERTREFGVTVAMGFTPPRLAALVTLEAAMATTVGWILGVALGYALLYYTHTNNVLGPLMALSGEVFPEAGLTRELYTPIRASYALSALSTVATAAFFALLFPARRALKLDLAKALRWE